MRRVWASLVEATSQEHASIQVAHLLRAQPETRVAITRLAVQVARRRQEPASPYDEISHSSPSAPQRIASAVSPAPRTVVKG